MIICVLEGSRSVGKSTFNREIRETVGEDATYLHLDQTTPNTVEYFLELHNSEKLYILDRGWLSEMVYSTVYGRDEKFTYEDIMNTQLKLVPQIIIRVKEEEVGNLYERTELRDNVVLDKVYKRHVRQANQMFKLYADRINYKEKVKPIVLDPFSETYQDQKISIAKWLKSKISEYSV